MDFLLIYCGRSNRTTFLTSLSTNNTTDRVSCEYVQWIRMTVEVITILKFFIINNRRYVNMRSDIRLVKIHVKNVVRVVRRLYSD